jgi:hypothetical protein
MLTKMVEEGEGCNVGVKSLGIMKVVNPHVFHNSFNEDLDAMLSGLIGLVVLDLGNPGSFGVNVVDSRSFCIDCRVVECQIGGRVHKGSTIVMEVPVCIGNESLEVVDTVDMVVGKLEKDGHIGIGEADKIIFGGLSIDGEEECLGCCEG